MSWVMIGGGELSWLDWEFTLLETRRGLENHRKRQTANARKLLRFAAVDLKVILFICFLTEIIATCHAGMYKK